MIFKFKTFIFCFPKLNKKKSEIIEDNLNTEPNELNANIDELNQETAEDSNENRDVMCSIRESEEDDRKIRDIVNNAIHWVTKDQLPKNYNYNENTVVEEDGIDDDEICFNSCLNARCKEDIVDFEAHEFRAEVKKIIKANPFRTNIIELGNWKNTKFEYLYYYTNFSETIQILMNRKIESYSAKANTYCYAVCLTTLYPDTVHKKKLKNYFRNYANNKSQSKNYDCAFAVLKKDLFLLDNLVDNHRDTHILLHMDDIDLNLVTFKLILTDKRYRYILDIFS